MPRAVPLSCGSDTTLAQAKAVIAGQTKGTQFSRAETDELLCIVLAQFPIGMEVWKDCESDWTAIMPSNPSFKLRNATTLKQMFTQLADTTKPNMQLCVHEAKHINALMHSIKQDEIEKGKVVAQPDTAQWQCRF